MSACILKNGTSLEVDFLEVENAVWKQRKASTGQQHAYEAQKKLEVIADKVIKR